MYSPHPKLQSVFGSMSTSTDGAPDDGPNMARAPLGKSGAHSAKPPGYNPTNKLQMPKPGGFIPSPAPRGVGLPDRPGVGTRREP